MCKINELELPPQLFNFVFCSFYLGNMNVYIIETKDGSCKMVRSTAEDLIENTKKKFKVEVCDIILQTYNKNFTKWFDVEGDLADLTNDEPLMLVIRDKDNLLLSPPPPPLQDVHNSSLAPSLNSPHHWVRSAEDEFENIADITPIEDIGPISSTPNSVVSSLIEFRKETERPSRDVGMGSETPSNAQLTCEGGTSSTSKESEKQPWPSVFPIRDNFLAKV